MKDSLVCFAKLRLDGQCTGLAEMSPERGKGEGRAVRVAVPFARGEWPANAGTSSGLLDWNADCG